jgi:uncharacterized protein YbjT (DUF2867 family)
VARVTVVSATGVLGQALLRRLAESGHQAIAVGRDKARLATPPSFCETRFADLTDPPALLLALADAALVVVCANAAHLPAVLAALPPAGLERLVVMGSTRRFSAVPDATAMAVREAEAALSRLAFPTVMLLATMIYGTGQGVIERLGRLHIVPAPLGVFVQPIHVDDLAHCLEAALFRPEAPGTPIVVAGPDAVSYRDLVRRTANAHGRFILTLPVPRLLLAGIGGLLGERESGMALRRLAENKTYGIEDMRRRLGVEPRTFYPAA